VFKTNRGDYVAANIDIPINSLPFEEEGLAYLCALRHSVESFVKKPEHYRELESGIRAYLSYWTHLNIEQVREAIKNSMNGIQSEIVSIKGNKEHYENLQKTKIPVLQSELENLKKLEKSI
jgi:hypothetical protein